MTGRTQEYRSRRLSILATLDQQPAVVDSPMAGPGYTDILVRVEEMREDTVDLMSLVEEKLDEGFQP